MVWDVDLLSPDVIKSYSADDPNNPTVYQRGDVAKAGTVLPGWEFPVDNLFA